MKNLEKYFSNKPRNSYELPIPVGDNASIFLQARL